MKKYIPHFQVAHGIMFHHFHDVDVHHKVQGSIDADTFDSMLRYIGVEHFLPPSRWYKCALQGTLRSGDLCLTFDDALKCQYDIALPVMEYYGLTAFWFVYSSVFEGDIGRLEIYRHVRTTCFKDVDDFYDFFLRTVDASPYKAEVSDALQNFVPQNYQKKFSFYTDNDRTFRYIRDHVLGESKYFQIMDSIMEAQNLDIPALTKQLFLDNNHINYLNKHGHLIGLHSYSHPTDIESMSYDCQKEEYERNALHLSSTLGCFPRTVSHPCNSYNKDTLEILKDIGVKTGFRANMQYPDRTGLEFPREDHANILRMIKPT